MSITNRIKLAHREMTASRYIPYVAHVDACTVRTSLGDYVRAFRLSGASFESADDATLNQWHERLNVLWRNIASPNVAMWTHVVRRRELPRSLEHTDTSFAGRLAGRYQERLARETLMTNDWYLTLVYRPVHTRVTGVVAKLMTRHAQDHALSVRDALNEVDKIAQTLVASLSRYDPELLQIQQSKDKTRSTLLEFLGLLINAESQPWRLPRAPLNDVLLTARTVFGTEVIEYRAATTTRWGAMLGIKEYPTPTSVGMLNALLSVPFAFVLTQSFTCLSKAAAQGLLQRQFHRFGNAGDFAVSQAEELRVALDQLTSNEFVMGDHHFGLQVLTEWVPSSISSEQARGIASLNDHVALARAVLGDAGIAIAREDLGLEASYWAQLPGNFMFRARKAPITSRNFAALSPFHNYPCGRAQENHWGDALALLVTSAHSPYYFSLHASDPAEADGGGRKDTGHTFLCGPTGSGKTVFIGFLVALLTRRDVTQIVFDKDHGLEILVRALGGQYFTLEEGKPSGFNPLQLPPTADNAEFLKCWLRALARRSIALTAREEAELDQALRGVLALDVEQRRLSRLVEYTDATRTDGIHAALAPWCASTRGEYAWVFDNPEDRIARQLTSHRLSGFDLTRVLVNERIRAPVNLYLFHLVERLLDGRRLVCWIDEFSHALKDADFQAFADNAPKTWRKLNGVLAVATQTASSVLDSDISRTIIEQTATKVFFPNPEASAREYIDGFSLTEREFLLLKEQLEPGSRKFLVKQGHCSVVCELDLKGFKEELTVISGRKESVIAVRELVANLGASPEQWLPSFLQQQCH
jgi:type IV secretion system protein VirB4